MGKIMEFLKPGARDSCAAQHQPFERSQTLEMHEAGVGDIIEISVPNFLGVSSSQGTRALHQ